MLTRARWFKLVALTGYNQSNFVELESRHMKQRCVLIIAILLLAGCGQKGPLYLPETEAENAPVSEDILVPDPSVKATNEMKSN